MIKSEKLPMLLIGTLIGVSLTLAPWIYIFSRTEPADVLANQEQFQDELKQIFKELETRTDDRFRGETFQDFLHRNPELTPPKGFE